MALFPAGEQIILALAAGWTLKSHRYLDGSKTYQLHPLDGARPVTIAWETVDALREQGLIDSNKKFPAATYLLTDKGRHLAACQSVAGHAEEDDFPLTTTGWQA